MNGWGPGEPAWWLNLQSHPDAVVETRRGNRRVHSHCAQGAERERLWARWAEIDHNLDAYAALRPAETAVVVLSSDDDMTVRVAGAPASVRPAVEAALAAQGFGVLTEIDVAATLKKKLDKDVPAQVILGACNPYLADRALAAEPSIGLLLPCNVVLRDDGNEGAIISALDPAVMVNFTGNADLEPIAAQARAKLKAALKSIVAADRARAAER
jgi:uncharacterized protein (DUF302 family)